MVLGALVWVVMPATCSALVSASSGALVDAGTLKQVIAEKTAELDPVPTAPEYGPPPPEAVCFGSDVKQLRCPSACAIKRSTKWESADRALQSCMRSIGCNDGESKGATVGLRCDCGKVGAK